MEITRKMIQTTQQPDGLWSYRVGPVNGWALAGDGYRTEYDAIWHAADDIRAMYWRPSCAADYDAAF